MQYLSINLKQTANLAKRLVNILNGGEIIALTGDLGAGKTAFSQAIAKCLGVKEPVISPTFTIWQQYDCFHPIIKKLIHIDAYRLSSGRDLVDLGINDWTSQKDVLIIIEWPEKINDWLPENTLFFNLKHHPDGRLFELPNSLN
ncbi:MAG TPA: tRNA (adenosine(37)-N6)-threonylcarbamoyltransferase complex ATPase subunit type 1 TsaE [bacterium]|nr:tRNA (adenosine(37)-N6)-threonylcarbamoyltransferase complex ATPase subunit type 1 TsaE [bacterium]